MQSEGIIGELIYGVGDAILGAGLGETNKKVKEVIKQAPLMAKNMVLHYQNKKLNEFNKNFTLSEGLGITITNNVIKDIIKVIRSLENKVILLKEIMKRLSTKR